MTQSIKLFIAVHYGETARELLWVSQYRGGVSFGLSPPKDAIPELQQRGYPDQLILHHILGRELKGNVWEDVVHGTYHCNGFFRPAYEREMKEAGLSLATNLQPLDTLSGIICLGCFGYRTVDIIPQSQRKLRSQSICFDLEGVSHFHISLFLMSSDRRQAFYSRDSSPGFLNSRIERCDKDLKGLLLGVEFCGTP